MTAPPRPEPTAEARPVFTPVPTRVARLVLAAALAGLGVWVAWPFVPGLAWAVTLAIALWPLYSRFAPTGQGGRAVLPPLAFTLATGLVVVVPLSVAAVQAGAEGQTLAEWLGRAQQNGLPEPEWLQRTPVVGSTVAAWWRAHLADPRGAAALFGNFDKTVIANWTTMVGTEFLRRGFVFFVTMLALFFLFREGEWLGGRLLEHAERMLGGPGERLAERLVLAARGTFNGTVLVAVGEGVLIGAGYVLAGVPQPVLFGVMTIAFAMLPFGAWFAFTAATIVLLAAGGGSLAAALLFVWGAAVMLSGDYFVQPRLVGASVRLPFLWTFIGIFGGVHSFGLLGLFIGPVIMTALITIWRDWIDRQRVGATCAASAGGVPARDDADRV